ncbi:MAG TPA: amino acid adenylation domain-containing protein, partial [Longimicrobiaceae bacterium]
LALRLRTLGVGPEARVALVLDRSPELAVAVLAVLRAGGAFVPLDPDYPAGRLAFVLRDSDAALVLTRADLAARLPEHRGRVVLVEAETGGEVETAPCPVHPDNLAYAVYTSGSTGRPKAAMVSHRSLVAYARAMRAELRLSPDDRVLQFASPGFDVVVEELFPAWTAGAAVVFPEGEELGSPAELMRLVEARGVTGFELPTAYWHECVRQLAEDGLRLPACVRWVIVGGERVLPERLRAWAGLGVPLVHVFGLTETTVTSTTLRLEAGDDGSRWPNLPIGTPTESSRVYVLDRAGHPAPMGVPGELWVGGEGVARGYLGRPELTAERYVPDPFGAPGARAYRTGDRVRWLADGKLEFLGRIDQQVKVRGFRIEPAEVEAVLAEHPGVGEAVVVVRDAGGGDRRLVAYLVSAEGAAPPVAELREHVARALPAYMVPAAFVPLDRLPLTPHGKLDRRALPDPDAGSLAPEAPYEAPGTAAERALAAVWAEVLRVERVGARDNFFELGGDSILSIQVVSRARRAGLHLTPRQLFENPTVAALAALAGASAGPGAEQGEVAGEVELTPVQHWFFEQEVPEPHHWNMPLLLVPGEPLDAAALEEALARLATHHDALRTRFRRAGGGWRQAVAPAGARVPVETLDLSALPEAERAAAIEREGARVQRSLELAEGPLFRAALFDLGGGAQRLLLAVHHLVVDGVSWRVLVEDLETALAGGALPPKTTSFRAWAHRLAEHARAGGFDAEIPFWTDPARAEAAALPADFEGAVPTHATLRQTAVSLDEPTTRALLRDAPRVYRTRVDDVLLTALARALEGWSGGRGALVELEGHGREEHLFEGVDLSRTVGWFTTQFPVLLSPGMDAPPGEALKAVKEQLRAVPHRGIGYGALRWLSADPETRARLAALPRPQVAFNYLGRIDEGAGDGGEAPFTLAREGVGASESPEGRPAHPLVFNARVAGGRLHVSLAFSEAVHRRPTAERLADAFLAELRALVEHCASPEAGGCTPGDFPLAGLDQAGLDRLVGSGRDVEDVYPLSPMQEGMLFHTLLEPGGGAYVGQQGFALRGALDRDAFRRAWESVVARHTALRSAFAWEGLERPLQTVRRRVEVELREEDWRDASPADRAERLDAFLREDRSRGLDPARAPLMRLALFRTGDAEHHLVWTFHQMMLDGWSLPLVFREAAAAYDAFRQGREPALPAARPYRDYVAWLQRRDDAGAERFWRAELAGFSAPTPLVVDRPAGAGEAGHGAAMLRLDEAATRALHAAARREGLTPNTLVQGAWALLLSRYSGEADVVFGVTTSGRPAELEGVEEAVGLFINTLPARVRIAPPAPLGGWLRGIQERQAAFREHEHVPLVRVQRWSAVPAGRPLFESLVVFENYPVEGVPGGGGGGLEIHPVDAREQGNYPLTLVVLPGARLTLDAQYDRARLNGGAVERMLGHLRNLLAGMAAAAADAPLSALSLLTGEERRALVAAGLAAVPELPRGPSIHALFEAAARRAPDAAAVTFEGESLAYGELNRRANLLAHHLRSRGVGPEVRVGLLLERGPEMVVAMLAVLKAGGAYVPVDPSAPADRVRWVLGDCGAPLVLTQRALAGALPAGGAEAVLLDAEWPRIAAGPAHDPEGGAGPDGLAYVIYTSGSTGRPKGVQVEHHSVVRLFRATEEWFGFGPDDVWTLFHSYAFDFSVWEAWGALLYGGRLVVVPAATSRDPEAFHALVVGEGVTVLSQTPSAFRPFAEVDGERGGELALRLVVFGGEALEPSSLRPWVARHGDARPRLVNMYGITETTVHVTCRPLTRADVEGEAGSVIGVPIPDLSLHLLGPDGEPVPVGVPGEICVGGAGVARGYLNRPELTAERFVGDPFGEGRLYRSGDLARRRADGELEYLGRADQQVKVRGFRIEPGEVEAALRALPGVRDAVVVARADGSGDLRLVGYVVGGEEGAPPADAMREALRGRLPEYMVPSALVSLEAIPLTANGKVDRAALPAPEGASASAAAYVAPRTPEEEALAAIWAEVLGVERVGVHQDFFEAGGHSLLVIRVVSRVRERFRVDLPLSVLFDAPTVAGLAAEVARRAPAPEPAAPAPSTPVAGMLPDDVDDLSEEELDALLARLAAEEEPES